MLNICPGRERFGKFGCYDVIVPSGGVTWHAAYGHCAAMDKALFAIETKEENYTVKYCLQQIESK